MDTEALRRTRKLLSFDFAFDANTGPPKGPDPATLREYADNFDMASAGIGMAAAASRNAIVGVFAGGIIVLNTYTAQQLRTQAEEVDRANQVRVERSKRVQEARDRMRAEAGGYDSGQTSRTDHDRYSHYA